MSSSPPRERHGFLGLAGSPEGYDRARVVVLPVPWERAGCVDAGAYLGPQAILAASGRLPAYDEELAGEPAEHGIFTLPPCRPDAGEPRTAFEEIRAAAAAALADGKLLATLGGERSITLPLVEAAAARVPRLGVLQLDAHAALREEDEGSRFAPACLMRRVHELGVATLAIGVRSLDASEAEFVRKRGLAVIPARQLSEQEAAAAALDELPEAVHVTLDVDFFDPSVLPGTATPEPGGADWYGTLRLLRLVFARKKVISFDVVGLAPIQEQRVSELLLARLVYKCIGYALAANPSPG